GRFGSCTELVRALLGELSGAALAHAPHPPAAPGKAAPRRRQQAAPRSTREASDTKELTGIRDVDTDTPRLRRSPPLVPALAGYRFLDNVGTTQLADVWKAQAPDGRQRLVKFIYGFSHGGGSADQDPIVRLKTLHHPGLQAAEVVQADPGCLVLVTDLVEET